MAEEWDLPEIGLRRLGTQDIKLFWDGYKGMAAPGLRHGSLYSRWRHAGGDLVISIYITNHSVGMFVRGERGERFATTANRLEVFEPKLGKSLGVSLRGYEGCCFLSNLKLPTTDSERWPEGYDWLDRTERHYLRVLNSLFEADPL